MNKRFILGVDCDGVVANTLPLMYQSACEVLRRAEIPQREWPTLDEWFWGVKPPWIDWYRGLGVNFSEPEVFRIFTDFMLRDYCTMSAFQGVAESLGRLHDAEVEIFLITAQDTRQITPFFRRHKLSPIFPNGRMLGRDHSSSKVENIQRAWDSFPGREFLYVGDTPPDITDAIEAGARPLAMCHTEGPFIAGVEEGMTRFGAEECLSSFRDLELWVLREMGLA